MLVAVLLVGGDRAVVAPSPLGGIGMSVCYDLRFPALYQRLVDLGFDPIGGTPEQFAANIRSETDKWARVIKATGLKLDTP